MNIFEQATRQKLRWQYKGIISVEDLWDVSVEQLDGMYRMLNRQLKETASNGLLVDESVDTSNLKLSLDIIKHIFDVKQAESKAAVEATAKRQRKQKLLEVLSNKQDEELFKKTPEEIAKMIDEL